MHRNRPVRIGFAVALAAALTLSACSGGSNTSAGSAPGDSTLVGAPAPAVDAQAREAGTVAGAPASGELSKAASGPGAPAVVSEPKIIRSASIYLTVASVETAAAAVRGVAAGLGGQVSSESVNATDAAPPAEVTPESKAGLATVRRGNFGQLVLAIPADKLEVALDQLARLGTVVQRASSSQDVTASYVDTESRITTMKTSIERVRSLMGQAQNIGQIVDLEAQLTQRESQLESLQAQLAAMAARVAMSSVTVTISSNSDVVVPTPEPTGFLGGLASGWRAFLASMTVALTVIGALVPWLIALSIIGLPLLVWLRRRRHATAASNTTASNTEAPNTEATNTEAAVPAAVPVGPPAAPSGSSGAGAGASESP